MFKFALYDQNENDREYSFPLNCTRDEFDDWVEEDDGGGVEDYDAFVQTLEYEYGVLDCGSSDDDEAYFSYEIAPEQYPEVLEKFRQFFIKEGLVDA